jgi:putative copper resistance protein D
VLIGLVIGGGAAALEFSDPGPIIRYGVPLAKALMNLSMAVSIGSLVFAGFAANDKSAVLRKLLNLASAGAAVWAIAASVHFVLSFVAVSGAAFSLEQTFSQGLWVYATEIELGISLALNLLAAFAISILALSVSSLTATALTAALGLGSLIPLALIGHAAGTANHSLAVNSLGLHLVGIVTWVGGLIALFAIKQDVLKEARPMVARYSSLALASFVIVGISGLGSSYVRIPDAAGLFSAYGQMLFIKVGTA